MQTTPRLQAQLADSEIIMSQLLHSSARLLDSHFGFDYAKKNPILLAELARIGAENYFLNRKLEVRK